MSYKCLTNVLQMSYKCYAVEYDEECLYHRLAAWVVIHPVFSENICNIWGHCNWATHFLSDPGKPGCFHIWIIDLKDVNLAVLHREHYVRKEEFTSQGLPAIPLTCFFAWAMSMGQIHLKSQPERRAPKERQGFTYTLHKWEDKETQKRHPIVLFAPLHQFYRHHRTMI